MLFKIKIPGGLGTPESSPLGRGGGAPGIGGLGARNIEEVTAGDWGHRKTQNSPAGGP